MTTEFEKLGERTAQDPSIFVWLLVGAVVLISAIGMAFGLAWGITKNAGESVRDTVVDFASDGSTQSSGDGVRRAA